MYTLTYLGFKVIHKVCAPAQMIAFHWDNKDCKIITCPVAY